MLARIFTLKFSSVLGGFDDGDLRGFMKDKEVLSIRDHFFVKDEIPYMAVLVTYNLLRPETDAPVVEKRGERELIASRGRLAHFAPYGPELCGFRIGVGARHASPVGPAT